MWALKHYPPFRRHESTHVECERLLFNVDSFDVTNVKPLASLAGKADRSSASCAEAVAVVVPVLLPGGYRGGEREGSNDDGELHVDGR